MSSWGSRPVEWSDDEGQTLALKGVRKRPVCPKLKEHVNALASSSTEDESGWESEASLETDLESEAESIDEDDDGFDADSEGETYSNSPHNSEIFHNSDQSLNSLVNKYPRNSLVSGFSKFYYIPSTGEFVALEDDVRCRSELAIGVDVMSEEGSDTEVEEEDAVDGVVVGEASGTEGEGGELKGRAEEASETKVDEGCDEVDLAPMDCPIETNERNLNKLLNVMTETQQRLDEIFSRHNIKPDYPPRDYEVSLDPECVFLAVEELSKAAEDQSKLEEESKLELRSVGSNPELEEGAAEVGTTLKGNQSSVPLTEAQSLNQSKHCDDKEGEEQSAEVGWMRTESGWVLKNIDSNAAPTPRQSPGVENNGTQETYHTFHLDRFVMPSLTLVCSLGLLFLLARYNLVFIVLLLTLFVTFLNMILVTACYVSQIVRSRDLVNPLRSLLDRDLNVEFSIMTTRLSRIVLVVANFLESLRRAFLFRDLLNSLKLILVIVILYLVGEWLTIPRLVVTLNLTFFLTQLDISLFARKLNIFSRA